MTTPDAASRSQPPPLARRELVVAAVVMVALTRAVEPADAFLVAGLLPVVMLVAGRRRAQPRRPPAAGRIEALIIPAVLTGGAGAAIHLVPMGLGLVPILLGFAILLDRILALELRLLGQPTGATETDHSRVRARRRRDGVHRLLGHRDARAGRPRRSRAAPRPAGRASRRAGSW